MRGERLDLVDDFIEAGDRVLARAVWRVAGRGPDATMEFSVIFTLRSGKIVTQQYFWEHDEVLEALGPGE